MAGAAKEAGMTVGEEATNKAAEKLAKSGFKEEGDYRVRAKDAFAKAFSQRSSYDVYLVIEVWQADERRLWEYWNEVNVSCHVYRPTQYYVKNKNPTPTTPEVNFTQFDPVTPEIVLEAWQKTRDKLSPHHTLIANRSNSSSR
jgi:hypothetical protein